MAKLHEEFIDKIAAKIVKEGEPDDLAKFMLSGDKHIAAVQRYFYNLEANKKKKLTLKDNFWVLDGLRKPNWYLDVEESSLNYLKYKSFTQLSFFKLIAPSIIPFVEKLYIANTHLKDYSFLGNIKNLKWFSLQFTDDEHIKVLSALSSLQSVNRLDLILKSVNLQLLSTFRFSFECLNATNFIFETDPKCDKVFQPTMVQLYGNEELKNDFFFSRRNFQNYFAIFPHAGYFRFTPYIKIVDDISDLKKMVGDYYYDEVVVWNRDVLVNYHFFDFTGYPDSKVMKMLQDNKIWRTEECPYQDASFMDLTLAAFCSFPLAVAEIANVLAEKSLRRIPEDSNGKPEDYYRLTIQNGWGHKAEFEVLKTASVESLLQAYGDLTGMNQMNLHFGADRRWISGSVAANFRDGDVVVITFDKFLH